MGYHGILSQLGPQTLAMLANPTSAPSGKWCKQKETYVLHVDMRANLFLVKFDIAGLDHFGSFWYVMAYLYTVYTGFKSIR